MAQTSVPSFGEVAEHLRRVTVQVRTQGGGAGSGVWWPGGQVLTNAHVARGSRAEVEWWDGRKVAARVTARQDRRDLAVLQPVQPVDAPVAAIGSSEKLRVGELVVAVGNPLGFIGALTTGVVHSLGPVRGLGPESWVRAAIRLAPGNSGGPLANARGEVIGLNTMVMAGGVGLAVGSDTVARFLSSWAAGERPALLGVTLRMTRVWRGRKPTRALEILSVEPEGAAALASLQPGDCLLAANDQPLREPDDLRDALEAAQGGALRLQFVRGDGPVREVTACPRAWSAAA